MYNVISFFFFYRLLLVNAMSVYLVFCSFAQKNSLCESLSLSNIVDSKSFIRWSELLECILDCLFSKPKDKIVCFVFFPLLMLCAFVYKCNTLTLTLTNTSNSTVLLCVCFEVDAKLKVDRPDLHQRNLIIHIGLGWSIPNAKNANNSYWCLVYTDAVGLADSFVCWWR